VLANDRRRNPNKLDASIVLEWLVFVVVVAWCVVALVLV
jgi:hypothetical protein